MGNIDTTPPTRNATNAMLTNRERYAQLHSQPAACFGCHRLIDGVGFGFETYDAVGAFRTTDNKRPVDESGELINTDVDGPFRGGVELAQRLAKSAQVRSCVTTQWFRQAFARSPGARDACSVELASEAFNANKQDFGALVLALVRSHAFRNRSIP